jgi:hypothetical protein
MFGLDETHSENNSPSPQTDGNVSSPASPAPSPAPIANPISDTGFIETPPAPVPVASDTPTNPASNLTSEKADTLLQLKQDALQSLAPMVNKLDQSPEEKFKTIMMLIQASDNTDLVKEAYETAKLITDEKERAQALIDVVNEINYFTQHQNQTGAS